MKNIVFVLLALITLSSCANEKNFVKFHAKHEVAAAQHIWDWYPCKDSIYEKIVYKPGKSPAPQTVYVKANCDSAYQDALKEAAKNGGKVKVKNVNVPCPPCNPRVDTIIKEKIVYQTDKKLVVLLNHANDSLKSVLLKTNIEYANSKKSNGIKDWILLAIFCSVVFYLIVKFRNKIPV